MHAAAGGVGLAACQIAKCKAFLLNESFVAKGSAGLPGHRYGIVTGKEGYLHEQSWGRCGYRLHPEGLAGRPPSSILRRQLG